MHEQLRQHLIVGASEELRTARVAQGRFCHVFVKECEAEQFVVPFACVRKDAPCWGSQLASPIGHVASQDDQNGGLLRVVNVQGSERTRSRF